MNNWILWALPAALVVALVAWLALRGRGRSVDGSAARAPAPPAAAPPRPVEASPPDAVAVQHQAATEALRQARRRKAEDEARQQAERAAAKAALPAAAPQGPTAPLAAPARPSWPAAPAQPAARAEPAVRAAPAAVPAPPVARPAPPLAAVARVEPAAAAPLPRMPMPPPAQPVAPAAVQRPPARPAGPPTVLVADDSKVVRVKTGRLLEKQGWRVLLADDGQAALRCLDTESPDLLITDVEMPGLDGFALTRAVRAHPRWARLPVIMITSSDDKHRDEASAAGVNLLMGKPYAEEDLLRQAQTLLGSAVGASAVLH